MLFFLLFLLSLYINKTLEYVLSGAHEKKKKKKKKHRVLCVFFVIYFFMGSWCYIDSIFMQNIRYKKNMFSFCFLIAVFEIVINHGKS